MSVLATPDTSLLFSTIFSASQDGQLRIYSIRGNKNVDSVGHLRLHDHVQKILAVKEDSHRLFYVVTKRSGIVVVKSVSPLEFKYQQIKAQEMEKLLPFKAGCLPSSAA